MNEAGLLGLVGFHQLAAVDLLLRELQNRQDLGEDCWRDRRLQNSAYTATVREEHQAKDGMKIPAVRR